LGTGNQYTALAGVSMLVAHSLFKAPLFLVVGIIDHSTGTRDIHQLSGLRRSMPGAFWISVVAAASMAGLPPTLGLAAREVLRRPGTRVRRLRRRWSPGDPHAGRPGPRFDVHGRLQPPLPVGRLRIRGERPRLGGPRPGPAVPATRRGAGGAQHRGRTVLHVP